MRAITVAALAVVVLVVGAGAGYLAGTANVGTTTSVSTFITTTTATSTVVSTLEFTTTATLETTPSTIVWGMPVPIASVETGNVTVGGSPYFIAVNPNANRIYLASGSDVIVVVDSVSHTVITRITLPAPSEGGIVADYKTGMVYASMQAGVAEISGTTNKVVGELPFNFGYKSIAFDQQTETIYGSPETSRGGLIGADVRTGAVTLNISIGYWANSILVNPQADMIYAVGCNQMGLVCDSTVSVVNGTSSSLVKQIALGSAYYSTATIDGKRGFVYISGESRLVELDRVGNIVYSTYPDTCGPFIAMADDSSANQVIMAPQNYSYLLFYSGLFGNLLNMYSLSDAPQYVAFNPNTNETYVVVSESLHAFHGVAGTGHVNGTLIGANQNCLPP